MLLIMTKKKKSLFGSEIIQTSVRMQRSIHKQLKQIALDNEMSLNQLLEEAIELILKKYKSK